MQGEAAAPCPLQLAPGEETPHPSPEHSGSNRPSQAPSPQHVPCAPQPHDGALLCARAAGAKLPPLPGKLPPARSPRASGCTRPPSEPHGSLPTFQSHRKPGRVPRSLALNRAGELAGAAGSLPKASGCLARRPDPQRGSPRAHLCASTRAFAAKEELELHAPSEACLPSSLRSAWTSPAFEGGAWRLSHLPSAWGSHAILGQHVAAGLPRGWLAHSARPSLHSGLARCNAGEQLSNGSAAPTQRHVL